MHVGIAIQNNYPVDNEVRTRKIAKSLDRDGVDVTIFARNSLHQPAKGRVKEDHDRPEERLEYADVHRFSFGISTPIYSLLGASLPFNPFWFLWMLLEFHREKPDVVVATNIRAGPPAIVAARLLGIPVVIDLRENFPEFARLLPREGILDAVVHHPRLVGVLERFVITYADQVWVVVEERKEALVADGVDESKLVVVSNTPDLSEVLDSEAAATGTATVDGGTSATEASVGEASADEMPVDEASADGSTFRVVYVGELTELRGLDRVVEAMQHVVEVDDDVQLVIGGDGSYRSALERQSRERNVDENVTFLGWIDAGDVPAFLASGDLGIIPHEPNGFTNTTVPNKLFDYMAVGIPVLTTNMRPVARIVEETNCGRVLPSDSSPRDIADAILAFRRGDSETLGENGYQAVVSRYNWSYEAGRIAESLQRVQDGDERNRRRITPTVTNL